MDTPEKKSNECKGTMAAVGMFDGVHLGHLHLLEHLRREAAERMLQPLVVTFSNHPLSVIAPDRAPMLLSAPEAKMLQLAVRRVAVRMIPFTPELRMLPARDFLAMLREKWGVKAMLLGFNNRFGHDAPTDFDTYRALAAEEGIELVLGTEKKLEGEGSISSSEIRRLLTQGHIAEANAMLGHPYQLQGTVEHGREIGRTIGFPTANVHPSFVSQLIPGRGVYAARALMPDGAMLPAVVNIGSRPTTGTPADAPETIEAHLIDYSGDLYGSPITLNFIEHLRDEQRFPSLDALAAAIDNDRRCALEILK